MEPNSPKKIQFAVPLFQSQIDPEAAEQECDYRLNALEVIVVSGYTQRGRRRSPLARITLLYPGSAPDGFFAVLLMWGSWWILMILLGLYVLQIRKRRPTPASLVIMNEHVPPEKDEKRTNISQAESQSASPKQRKQSVFTPPALKGIKHLKTQSDSAFPEEEEGVSEREEEWGH